MSNKRAQSAGQVQAKELRGRVGELQESRRDPGSSLRKPPPSTHPVQETNRSARLNAAEETLRAILSGEVDALMVSGRRGAKLVSLKGGEPSYRLLVEAMGEGAATLSRNGAILYCNRMFARMMCRPPGRMIGIPVRSLIMDTERDRFETLLAGARKAIAKGEFNLRRAEGDLIPVYLSLNRFQGFKGQALGMVITDLSDQKRKQAEKTMQEELTRRLLLERTISAQEEERRRIARELHDEAGQMLTALLVGLRSLEDARKLGDIRVQAQRLREIAAQAIDEVGRLARGLHPTVLDDLGLGVALSRHTSEFAKTHNISVSLELNDIDTSDLPAGALIALYRILQEALTNVARHSGARTVSIRFSRLATAVEVAIIDDGRGFDAKAVAISSHRLGLHSMRERAAMLGGTVNFISQKKGTKILVHVPVTNRTANP